MSTYNEIQWLMEIRTLPRRAIRVDSDSVNYACGKEAMALWRSISNSAILGAQSRSNK